MNAQTSVLADGEPDIAWIIAAHEAGRADPDPFYNEGPEQ
jgi:hypothetical protein